MLFDYTSEDRVIYEIRAPFFPQTPLSDLIRVYGEPDYVSTFVDTRPIPALWTIRITWETLGLQLSTHGEEPLPGIDENLQLDNAEYFQPGLEGYEIAFGQGWLDALVPWQGYGDLSVYRTWNGSLLSIEQYRERWLGGIPCAPPCWEGIVFGQTSAGEVRDILESNLLLDEFDIGLLSPERNLGYVYFAFLVQDNQGYLVTWHGEMHFDDSSEEQVIHHMQLEGPPTSLGDLIQTYGEPSYAGATPDASTTPATWTIYIVWELQGLQLWASGSEPAPGIDAGLQLQNIDYFQPGLDGYALAFGDGSMDRLVPWQGYVDFDTYHTSPAP